MNMKRYSLLALALALCLLLSACSGNVPSAPEVTAEPVTLTIAGGWDDCPAIEEVARRFALLYPNCTIRYEYIQDYYESLAKRMTGDNVVDIFFTTNIQSDSLLMPYAEDLKARADFSLDDTFEGLISNFAYRENGEITDKLYAIPLGAEMRGLFVNKTLLASLGLDVPKDRASLLAACKVLKENGYTPMHGNPADFSHTLLYPWICNIIANSPEAKAIHEAVEARSAGVSEYFREPFELMYNIVENDYYNYKSAQDNGGLFVDSTDTDYARYFFNIVKTENGYEKADDKGIIAFMPSPISRMSVIEKVRDDYHSEIEYVFIAAPVGEEGGFVYLSPAHGIAANKTSANLDWSIRFLDFLFKPENNKIFADKHHIIPNTKEAATYISGLFDVPSSRVSELGQVTFAYNFYDAVTKPLRDVSKANNPKYMQTAEDGSTSLYPFDYYMQRLEESLTANE